MKKGSVKEQIQNTIQSGTDSRLEFGYDSFNKKLMSRKSMKTANFNGSHLKKHIESNSSEQHNNQILSTFGNLNKANEAIFNSLLEKQDGGLARGDSMSIRQG